LNVYCALFFYFANVSHPFLFLKNNTVYLKHITESISKIAVHELKLIQKVGKKVKNLDDDGEVAAVKFGKQS